MADQHRDPATFMSLPLEIRHMIFKHAASCDSQPKELLRYWFENNEIRELVAQNAVANPNGPAPRVLRSRDGNNVLSQDSDGGEEDQGGEYGDGEGGDEDDEEEEENNDQEHDNENDDDEEEGEDMDQETEDGQISQLFNSTSSQAIYLASIQPQPFIPVQPHVLNDAADEEDEDEEEDKDNAGDEEAQAEFENQAESDEDDDNGDEGEILNQESDEANTATLMAQPPPPAPVIRPHTKWRHIPNFMRITHCPPPVELLLASKQLNNEAKNWYYDVAVLRIEATGSFAHTSFFEEAFNQITEAAYSPMENLRKIDVTFAWDTTWIRADETGCVEAIFPALLRQRANFVYQILLQAPDLKELVIHWHDSAQDDESANLRLDILEPFFNLPASVQIKEYYVATDAKPHKNSIAGKRRIEFQSIIDVGLERLF